MRFTRSSLSAVALTTIWLSGCSLTPKEATDDGLQRDPTSTRVTIGSQLVQQLEIAVAMEPARQVRLYSDMGWDELDPNDISARGETPIGWNVQLVDPYNREQVPYGKVRLEVTTANGDAVMQQTLAPLVTFEGLHYVNLGALLDDGEYNIAVTADLSVIGRSEAYGDLWQDPITAQFAFKLENSLIYSAPPLTGEMLTELPAVERPSFDDVAGENVFEQMGVKVSVREPQPYFIYDGSEWVMREPAEGEYFAYVQLTDLLLSQKSVPHAQVEVMAANQASTEEVVEAMQPIWSEKGLIYGGFIRMEPGSNTVQANVGIPRFGREVTNAKLYEVPIEARFGHDFNPPMQMAAEPEIAVPEPVAEVAVVAVIAHYTVQSGVFLEAQNADLRLQALEAAGYSVYRDSVELGDGSQAARLTVGPYDDEASANGSLDAVSEIIGERAFVVAMCRGGGETFPSRYLLQAGPFEDLPQAETLQQTMEAEGWSAASMSDPEGMGGHFVRTGNYANIWGAIANSVNIRRQFNTTPRIIPICN